MSTIFTPKSDDKFATATELVEVATVKPSGYMILRAVVHPAALPATIEAVNLYYENRDRPQPVIYTRQVGTVEWHVHGDPTVEIPDALPDDFQ